MAAVFYDILTKVVTEIQDLNLSEIHDDDIVLRKHERDPRNPEHVYQGITVAPSTPREGRGTNKEDDIGYGVFVTLCRPTAPSQIEAIDVVTLWRQTICQHFRHQRLSGVTKVFICTIRERTVYASRDFEAENDVSGLELRFWARELTR